MDGASRLQKIWHITLPGIRPTIIVLLIMSIGGALNVGMERQMLLSNPLVEDHTMVLSWFSYKRGIGNSNYGLGTAIGVFQSAVSVTLLLIANKIAGEPTPATYDFKAAAIPQALLAAQPGAVNVASLGKIIPGWGQTEDFIAPWFATLEAKNK